MKVLIYSENINAFSKSGIGKALLNQKKAYELNGVETTFDINDTYDICHIHTIFKKSYKFLKKLKKRNIPVVVHGHSTKEDFLNSFKFSNIISPIFNKILLRMYKKADYILTPTNYSKNLIENYKGIKAKVYYLSNGVDLESFNQNIEMNKDFYKKLNIDSRKKYILGIGFYFKRKGLIDFIEIAKKFPNINFIWLGKKYKFITSVCIKKALKNKPDNLILPGYISSPYKEIGLKNASAFLFPSYEETEGIVVLEAMAAKTPLIVRDIGVYDGWLDSSNSFKCKNNIEFVNTINYILNNDVSSITNNAYEFIQSRDLKIIGKHLIDIDKEIINDFKMKINSRK